MRLPSSTARGRRWVSNFSPADRPAAVRLVDSLRFVGGTEFRASTSEILRDHVEHLVPRGPVALHPIRNDPKYRMSPFDVERGLPDSGSALIALNIAAEVSNSVTGDVFVSPDVQFMRNRRVRNIVFVDDFIGSGRSIQDCIGRWRQHPSIKSWMSYHLINFHLVAYSSTTSGYNAVAASKIIDMRHVRTHSVADDMVGAKWTKLERAEIVEICSRYANNKRNLLGVGGAGALIVFDHTVPNNLPRILLQNSGPNESAWSSFFPVGRRRLDAAQAVELMGYRPPGSRLVAEETPATVLAEQDLLDRNLRTLLLPLKKRARFPTELQSLSGFTDYQVRYLLKRARDRQLVTTRCALTEAGLEWLANGATPRVVDQEPGSAYYYPSQLRGVDDF